ncbi:MULTISPECIES: DUF4160 domain-containing protein [Caulobacter]|uniref:DUF4160 domain-containing protein n=1 Tax=Caulobacter vibrioides OR37 TaxID=1292034 RepID=R0D460_CAUVI|nr:MULTISPECIES: DUF4160 domain-containing protein [Caulobacter]ENZ83180.1 hypothetical protein OR37_00955 [Caulobacter vibrioides OR37]MBQ1561886.1 DUF4160 domain-containing protein [Caulobacter sp.]
MPIISTFFGIVIRIYFSDHNPPHLHAEYQEYEAMFDIRTCEVLEGQLPRPQKIKVVRWIRAHQVELADNWDRAYNDRPTFRIQGLDQP